VKLAQILAACQGEHAKDWELIRGEGVWLDPVLVQGDEGLTIDGHLHHAVFAPDARLTLQWGFAKDAWHDHDPPDWASEWWGAGSARHAWAHVVFCGAIVWQISIALIDAGAGKSGVMVWPEPAYDGPSIFEQERVGWRSTIWERGLTDLINALSGHHEFKVRSEEVTAGVLFENVDPVSAARRNPPPKP